MYLKSDKVYFEDGFRDGFIEVEDQQITGFLNPESKVDSFTDYSGYRIIPGIIDTHIHGTRGYCVMDPGNTDRVDEIKGFLKGCAADGITGVFPTAFPDMLRTIVEVAEEDLCGARVLGIHSEGPYLNRVGENGIQVEPPVVDMALVEQIYEDCGGYLKLMAIAPEIEGSQEVVDYLRAKGVVLSFAHSNCNYEEAMDAFDRGITVSTHTANVMRGIHHRDVGGLGACLLNDKVHCEVICDGMHVTPTMLEIMFHVKNYNYWFMVSDCTPMSGAPEGVYKLMGDVNIIVDGQGFCKTETGRLMGSSKSVLHGISVLTEQLDLPLETVLRMSSLNVAQFYGFGEQKGSIKVGKDADLVVIDDSYNVIATYVEGQLVYDANLDEGFFNEKFLVESKSEIS